MLRALGENVVVAPKQADEQSKGGVYLPESAKDKAKPTEGQVLDIGPELEDRVLHFKVGDTVVFSAYAGVHAKDGDRAVIILKRNELLAVRE